MSADAIPAAAGLLPRRTWRHWWLAWPKWLRIGAATFGAAMLLQLLIAIRIAIGLVESQEVASFRREGVHIDYFDPLRKRSEWFEGQRLIYLGLVGRSAANVEFISVNHATDDELQYIGAHFRKLVGLDLWHSDVTSKGYAALRACRKLKSLEVSIGSEIDDEGVKQLIGLEWLTALNLPGTLVTNEVLSLLPRFPRLERLNVFDTDVTREAVEQWRVDHPHRQVEFATSRSESSRDSLYCSVRWADGERSASFHHPYELSVAAPASSDGGCWKVFDVGKESERWVIFPRHHLQDGGDGEYRFRLKLGNAESEPITVMIADGRRSTDTLEFQMPVTKAEAMK